MAKHPGLVYIGENPSEQWLPGIPARDMSGDEVDERIADPVAPLDPAECLASGWYKEAVKAAPKPDAAPSPNPEV